ncbi:MAG: uroporphyrinogen-III synthase [Dokdonella sp.]
MNPIASKAESLAGVSVVVTRPATTAAVLVRAVQARGGTALRLPGLILRAPTNMLATAADLRSALAADIWIFASPSAVEFAWRVLPSLRIPRRLVVLAVGRGTARELAKREVAAIVPVSGDESSEGLLELGELANVKRKQIALVGAAGGRGLLVPELKRRGAHVEQIHVYRRAAAKLTQRQINAVANAELPIITLLSSGEALSNLVTALPEPVLEKLRSAPLVVSSARLTAIAKTAGFARVSVAESPAPNDLVARASALQLSLDRRVEAPASAKVKRGRTPPTRS